MELILLISLSFIPGNEHGRVVGDSVFRVLARLGHLSEVSEFDLGPERYRTTGEVLPDSAFEAIESSDALFVGAPPLGAPDIPRGVLERGIVFRLRFGLDLSVNLRSFRGPSPGGPMNVAFVRENTEGPYAGEGGILRAGTPHAVATQGSLNTRFGIERCIRYAFALASKRRKSLTLVHKVPVLEYSGQLWEETFHDVGEEFNEIERSYLHVDAACVHLVQDPARFDVVVTDNLFGDILTDLAAALSASFGRSGSASLNPEGTGPSMFEPIHGLDYRRNRPAETNPLGAYAAAAMMLDHMGEHRSASRLQVAIDTTAVGDGQSIGDVEAEVIQRCA